MALRPVSGDRQETSVTGSYERVGAGICNDPFYPDVVRDAEDDYSNPLKLLARGLRFIDPITGVERSFESAIALRW